jgi:hypothetical protein
MKHSKKAEAGETRKRARRQLPKIYLLRQFAEFRLEHVRLLSQAPELSFPSYGTMVGSVKHTGL